MQVFEQYSEKLTNTATIAQKAETIAVPTFSICTGWKESIMEKYNVGPKIFFFPPSNDTNLPSSFTLEDLFVETTYRLSEDFSISISTDLLKPPKPLKVGRNEITQQGSFQVKENPTYGIGMCYVIIPDQLFIRPFQDTLGIFIAKNLTDGNDKLLIQISSNDTFNTINSPVLLAVSLLNAVPCNCGPSMMENPGTHSKRFWQVPSRIPVGSRWVPNLAI